MKDYQFEAMMSKLEEIRCGIIDVEVECQKANKHLSFISEKVSVVICPECKGDKAFWRESASGHGLVLEKCQLCNGKGKAPDSK